MSETRTTPRPLPISNPRRTVGSSRRILSSSGSRVLESRFRSLAGITRSRYGNVTNQIQQFFKAKTDRQLETLQSGNIETADTIANLVDQQNELIRDIIDEFKKDSLFNPEDFFRRIRAGGLFGGKRGRGARPKPRARVRGPKFAALGRNILQGARQLGRQASGLASGLLGGGQRALAQLRQTFTPRVATPVPQTSILKQRNNTIPGVLRKTVIGIADRLLAPTLFLDIETALRDMGDRAEYLPVSRLQTFRETLRSAQDNVVVYNQLLRSLETEQNSAQRAEIEIDIERQRDLIANQRNRLIQMAVQLDEQAQAEYQRRIRRSQNGRSTISEHIVRLAPITRYVLGDERDTSLDAIRRPSDFRALLEGALQGAPEAPAETPPTPPATQIPTQPPVVPTEPPTTDSEPNAAEYIVGASYNSEDNDASPVDEGNDAAPADDMNDLPYPENIIDVLMRTEFQEIELHADKIEFDGELSLGQQDNTPMAIPTAMGGVGPAAPGVVATQQAPQSEPAPTQTEGGGTPTATPTNVPAAMAPQQSSPTGAASQATPVARSGATPQSGQTAGRGSAEEAMNFFIGRGWTREQAAGIVGNLDVETGGTFNPAAINDSEGAYGIAQWRGSRRTDFERWSGRSIVGSTFQQQLEFIHYELTQGNERSAGNKLRRARTATEATEIVDQFYERSNGVHRQRRIEAANRYLSGAGLSAAGTEMAVGDQARQRAGQQIIMIPGQPGASGGQQTVVPNQTHSGEVSLKIRFEKQVA